MDRTKTGALIAAARKEQNMTQKELAAALHVSDRAVSKWERGAGFPDISLLEPLADALGLGVLDLLQGERGTAEVESDGQVRGAVRIVVREANKKLHRLLRGAKIFLAICVAVVLFWKGYEFFKTNGDGFDPVENRQVIQQGYENNCRGLSGRGIYQIEVTAPDRYTVITDAEDIDRFLAVLAQIEVKGTYREWGPHSLDNTIRVIASGWTPDDQFIDTEDYAFALTFPAFTAGREGEKLEFYFEVEIDGEDVWTVIEEELDAIAGIS